MTQFKLPSYPNVLVCTDVLREGIDLHLFCDNVLHYGIAWSSGDLEQRIGRVDRFAGLLSRRLAAYTAPDLADMPRGKVGFPYLAGTLDSRQVERVRRRKAETDLTLDFGERAADSGMVGVDELYGKLKEKALAARRGLFDPEGLESVPRAVSDSAVSSLRQPDPAYIGVAAGIVGLLPELVGGAWARGVLVTASGIRYDLRCLPTLECFVLTERREEARPPQTAVVRWVYRKTSGRYMHFSERELLLPIAQKAMHKEMLERFTSSDLAEQLCGLARHRCPPGFHYSAKVRTASIDIEIDNPVEPNQLRQQMVCVEHDQGMYYLKSFVANADNSQLESYSRDIRLPRISGTDAVVVTLNDNCAPGWFAVEGKNIVHVWAVADLELVTPEYARRVAMKADRIQLLMTASDDQLSDHRSALSLEALCDGCSAETLVRWRTAVTSLAKRST